MAGRKDKERQHGKGKRREGEGM